MLAVMTAAALASPIFGEGPCPFADTSRVARSDERAAKFARAERLTAKAEAKRARKGQRRVALQAIEPARSDFDRLMRRHDAALRYLANGGDR